MAKDLRSLAGAISKLRKRIPESVNAHTKARVMAMVGHLTDDTPVDTSQAVSNWQVSVNKPLLGRYGPYFAGERGSTKIQSSGMAVTLAQLALAERKQGMPIHITNNQPYVIDLNEGSSLQAPAMFIEKAISKALRQKLEFKL